MGSSSALSDVNPSQRNNIALNPNHTCFILVDNGSASNFGIETDLRTKLEAELRRYLKIPMLLIVLGGGYETLIRIKAALDTKTPIILIAVSYDSTRILYNSLFELLMMNFIL